MKSIESHEAEALLRELDAAISHVLAARAASQAVTMGRDEEVSSGQVLAALVLACPKLRASYNDIDHFVNTELFYELDFAISHVVVARAASQVVTMGRDDWIQSGDVWEVLETACGLLRASYNNIRSALIPASPILVSVRSDEEGGQSDED